MGKRIEDLMDEIIKNYEKDILQKMKNELIKQTEKSIFVSIPKDKNTFDGFLNVIK